MKDNDKDALPDHYSHDGEFGRETSRSFAVLPDVPVSVRAKDAVKKASNKLGYFLVVIGGIIWAIATHPDELQKSWDKIFNFIYKDSIPQTEHEKNKK